MKVHNLKIKLQYFESIISGLKTFEVRCNDRNFKVGDIITLEEYKDDYTSKFVNAEITYILDDPKYCKKGYVILGFKLHLEMGGILQ